MRIGVGTLKGFLAAALVLLLSAFTALPAQAEPKGPTPEERAFLMALMNPPQYSGVDPIRPVSGRDAYNWAQVGHSVANWIIHGVDSVDADMWLLRNQPGITNKQSSWVTFQAMLQFAPAFHRWYFSCGTGPVCERAPLPAGAVLTPWYTPGIPPIVQYPS